jgi:hypothetical protein
MDSTVGDLSIVPGNHFVGGHPTVPTVDGYITHIAGSIVDAHVNSWYWVVGLICDLLDEAEVVWVLCCHNRNESVALVPYGCQNNEFGLTVRSIGFDPLRR